MSKIREILSGDTGLIPYLGERLGGDWETFQIRAWNFKTADPAPAEGRLADNDNNSGFRQGSQRSERSKDGRSIIITKEIRVGYILTHIDQYELQLAAAELSLRIDEIVTEWGCCTDWLSECVEVGSGGFVYSPNPTISSGNPGAWAIAVIREFEIVWIESPER